MHLCWNLNIDAFLQSSKFEIEYCKLIPYQHCYYYWPRCYKKDIIAYDLGKGDAQINHLIFMNDIMVYERNEKQFGSFVHPYFPKWIWYGTLDRKAGCSGNEIRKIWKKSRNWNTKQANNDNVWDGQWYKCLRILEAIRLKKMKIWNKLLVGIAQRGWYKILQLKLNSTTLR